MLLQEVAATSAQVAATSGRSRKIELVAGCLRAADAAELPVLVAYLSGELRQRRTGLGYAALRELPAPAETPTLEVLAVDAVFQAMSELAGTGSGARRRALALELFAAATAEEQRLVSGLVSGELRQGALEGVMLAAVSVAGDVPERQVRRAVTLAGAMAPVAVAALTDGAAGLQAFALRVGQPLKPMLAQPAKDLAEAFERVSPAAVETKLDGIRVQVHRNGEEVRVFTRTLEDITARLPEVVETVRSLSVDSLVLDGEAIALRPDGRPEPFQVTASRTATRGDTDEQRARSPLSLFAFDLLHLDGLDLETEPGSVRHDALARVVPSHMRAARIVTADLEEARRFFQDAVDAGHEGVVVKSLDAPYEAGRRGTGWLKVKPRHTLDLVVLAAEWGHGRRHGVLSNLHLGARDGAGGLVMLGKTFKGLTDAMLAWQTERLLELADGPTDGWVVHVRPELVVEIAFDGVQTSPRYPGGVALRFARVLRHRPDKPAREADTLATVKAIWGG